MVSIIKPLPFKSQWVSKNKGEYQAISERKEMKFHTLDIKWEEKKRKTLLPEEEKVFLSS